MRSFCRLAPGQLSDHLQGALRDEAFGKCLSAEYTAAAWYNHSLADIVSC